MPASINTNLMALNTANNIQLDDRGGIDGLQLFSPSGVHIAGTPPPTSTTGTMFDHGWGAQFSYETGITPYPMPIPSLDTWAINPNNGFNNDASYDGDNLNGIVGGGFISFTPGVAGNNISYNDMNIAFSGEGNIVGVGGDTNDYLTIDEVKEDLILCLTGDGPIYLTATWTNMPTTTGGNNPNPPNPPVGPNPPGPGTLPAAPQGDIISIRTQDDAQRALERIDDAIVAKDKVRAHLGALQNRLENTVTNLTIQGENLQVSESQISDVDVSQEMTQFVRNQVMTQSAVAMLGQANSYPHMLMNLLTR